MKAQERTDIRAAIRHLEADDCQWEDAMGILYRLAGWEYKDLRKAGGQPVGLLELANEPPKTSKVDDKLGPG